MAALFDKLAEEVFQIIKGSGRTLFLFDSNGRKVWEPKQARRIFAEPDKLMLSISEADSDSEVKMYLSQDTDIKDISRLVNTLRQLATRFNVLFNVRKYGRELSPKDFAYQADPVSESIISEAMWGTTKTSYQKIGPSRLIVRHSAPVREGVLGSRGRNIQCLFVETKDGERFKFPVIHLSGARAWARHLGEGGLTSDDVGSLIVELAKESTSLTSVSRHILHNRNRLGEDAINVRSSIRERLVDIRQTLGKFSRQRGYKMAVENIDKLKKPIKESTEEHLVTECSRLQSLLSIDENHMLAGSLMPVALLTMGENKMATNTTFSRVIALENAEDLVEALVNEYGYEEGSHWTRGETGLSFNAKDVFEAATYYLDLSETAYMVENPDDKFAKYATAVVTKRMQGAGEEPMGKEFEQAVQMLTAGLKELASGRLQVRAVAPDSANFTDPAAGLAAKIAALLDPKAGMKNDALWNYLSGLVDKLQHGSSLTPAEKVFADKAAVVVDKAPKAAEESVVEDMMGGAAAGDHVGTPIGPGIVLDVDIDGTYVVELQNGSVEHFIADEVEKVDTNAATGMREMRELEEWFGQFDPMQFLGTQDVAEDSYDPYSVDNGNITGDDENTFHTTIVLDGVEMDVKVEYAVDDSQYAYNGVNAEITTVTRTDTDEDVTHQLPPEVFKELEMQVPGGHGDPQAYHEESVVEAPEEVAPEPANPEQAKLEAAVARINSKLELLKKIGPQGVEFDSIYKHGEHLVFEKNTKTVVAYATSGGALMSMVDGLNSDKQAGYNKVEGKLYDSLYDFEYDLRKAKGEVDESECVGECDALPGDAGDDFVNDVTVQPVQGSDDELARLRKLAGI